METVKFGARAPANYATTTRGVVLEVDSNNVALVLLSSGAQARVRADMLRGKSAAPKAGEAWLFDQPYGSGWMFAIPMNYSGGDQDFTSPVMTNSWTSVDGIYLPVGYILDSEGWVTLRGRVTGGTANQPAFTLPVGYRPGGQIPFIVPVGTGSGLVNVTALGAVTPVGSGATSLEQVRFLAQD